MSEIVRVSCPSVTVDPDDPELLVIEYTVIYDDGTVETRVRTEVR